MSNDARRIVFSTRERALSDDLDNMGDLLVRQIINNLAYQAAPDELASLNLYGVINGLLVGSTGVALSVTVDIGLAIKYDPTAADVYDSKYRLIEVSSPVTVDVSSHVHPANPRWIVIEVSPGSAVESMSLRDIYNPSNGFFVPQSVPKVMKSEPVVAVTAGAAAVTPALPAGTPGRIPLAYVYLPAGALAVNPDQIIRCRPLLTPRLGEQSQHLVGGGWEVLADGDATVLPAGGVQFRPAFFPAPISLDGPTVIAAGGVNLAEAGAPMWAAGLSYPGTTAPIYLYLMSAPYPAGYDTNMAGREFVPGDQAAVAALIPSYTAGVSGGIIAAGAAPDVTTAPIGTSASLAVLGVNDPTWNGGPGVSSLTQGRVAYVGAVSYLTAVAGLLSQRVENKKHVRFRTTPGGDETQTAAGGGSTFNQLGNFAFALPLTLPAPNRWAPLTASSFEVLHTFSWSGTSPDHYWHLSVDEAPDPFTVVVSDTMIAGATLTSLGREGTNTFHTQGGLFRWETTNNGADAFDLRVRVWGYDDSMLERA